MKIKPVSTYLLISIHEGRKPKSKLVLPAASEPMFPYALVKDVGPDVTKFKVGDKVLCLPQNVFVVDQNANVHLLPEGAVFATIEGEPEEAEVVDFPTQN